MHTHKHTKIISHDPKIINQEATLNTNMVEPAWAV